MIDYYQRLLNLKKSYEKKCNYNIIYDLQFIKDIKLEPTIQDALIELSEKYSETDIKNSLKFYKCIRTIEFVTSFDAISLYGDLNKISIDNYNDILKELERIEKTPVFNSYKLSYFEIV